MFSKLKNKRYSTDAMRRDGKSLYLMLVQNNMGKLIPSRQDATRLALKHGFKPVDVAERLELYLKRELPEE